MPRSLQRVQIVDFGPRLNKPIIVVGVPEAGLVGTIASSYLVEQLDLDERGYIDSDYMPPVMVVHESAVSYPVHIFGKENVVVIISEVPLTGRLAVDVAKEIASWAKSTGASIIVGLTGAPSQTREEAQGDSKANVVGVGNDKSSLKAIKASRALPFQEGVISGFYASLLKYCTLNEQSGAVLLAESLAQFPDPGAAVSVVETLNGLVGLKVDVEPLTKEAEAIRLKTRELMQQTQQAQQPTGLTSGGTAYR